MTDPIRDAAIEAAAKVLYLSNYPDDGRNRLGRRGHVLAACWEEAVPLVDAALAVARPALRAEAFADAIAAIEAEDIDCETHATHLAARIIRARAADAEEGAWTADEALADLVDHLRSHGHGKFVDDYIADLVQAAKAEGWREGFDARGNVEILGDPPPANPYRTDEADDA